LGEELAFRLGKWETEKGKAEKGEEADGEEEAKVVKAKNENKGTSDEYHYLRLQNPPRWAYVSTRERLE
jgi:hypothetical protein